MQVIGAVHWQQWLLKPGKFILPTCSSAYLKHYRDKNHISLKKEVSARHDGTGLYSQLLKRLRQENQKFETYLGYIASLRPAWATWQQSVSK
jgi:hypothetical protein